MLKSLALRSYRISTKKVQPYCIGGSRKNGKACYLNVPPNLLQVRSSHSVGPYPSRGRISLIGNLCDEKSNRITGKNDSLGLPARDFSNYNFQNVPFSRMLFTTNSSQKSSSTKQDEIEDGTKNSVAANNSGEPQNANSDNGMPAKNSFRSMVQKYGKVFVGTYFGVYVSTVLGLFMSVQSGQLDAMYVISMLTGSSAPAEPGGVADPDTIKEAASAMKNLVELLESYTITRPVAPMVEEYPWTANFAIAWIATKFTEPIRFGATVVMTPPIARFLGYRSAQTVVRDSPSDVAPRESGPTSADSKKVEDDLSSTQSPSTR